MTTHISLYSTLFTCVIISVFGFYIYIYNVYNTYIDKRFFSSCSSNITHQKTTFETGCISSFLFEDFFKEKRQNASCFKCGFFMYNIYNLHIVYIDIKHTHIYKNYVIYVYIPLSNTIVYVFFHSEPGPII